MTTFFQGDERKVAIVVGVDRRFTEGKMTKRDTMKLSHVHDDGCLAKCTHDPSHCASTACKAFKEAADRRQAEINDERSARRIRKFCVLPKTPYSRPRSRARTTFGRI